MTEAAALWFVCVDWRGRRSSTKGETHEIPFSINVGTMNQIRRGPLATLPQAIQEEAQHQGYEPTEKSEQEDLHDRTSVIGEAYPMA